MASHTSICLMRNLGTCASLLLLALACDSKPTPTRAAGAPVEGGAAGTAEALARGEGPANRLVGVAALVTAGGEGYTAAVVPVSGGRYQWSVTGGEITSGANGTEITYRVADTATSVRVLCRSLDDQGREYVATTVQAAVPPPVLDRFEALPAVASAGSPVLLQWSAREIKSLVLDPGGHDVTPTPQLLVTPQATTTYVLTATNLAGATRTRQLTVKVVAAPEISALGTGEALVAGRTVHLRAEFAGGRAELFDGTTVLGASEQSPLVVPVTLREGLSVVLKVTNEAGATVTQAWSFQKAPK